MKYLRHVAKPILGITMLAAFLRFFQIGAKSLWVDEAFSVWMGWQPAERVLGVVARSDQHPPLYYLLLRTWLRIGDSPAVARSFSALWGTATVPLVHVLGRRLAGRKAGLAAAILLAVSPFHVALAQEARMYSLLAFLALCSLTCLLLLLSRPGAFRPAEESGAGTSVQVQIPTGLAAQGACARGGALAQGAMQPEAHGKPDIGLSQHGRLRLQDRRALVGYIVATVAAMLVHNTGVFLILAANLIAAFVYVVTSRAQNGRRDLGVVSRRPAVGTWILAQAVILFLWSPWIIFLMRQWDAVAARFWIQSAGWRAAAALFSTFVGAGLPPMRGLTVLFWSAVSVVVGAGLVSVCPKRDRAGFLMLASATPIASELVISIWRPILHTRSLAWASFPLYVLMGAGVCHLRRRSLRVIVLGVLLGGYAISLGEYYSSPEKESWDKAAATVAAGVSPGELVIFSNAWTQIPFDYYFRGYSVQVEEHGIPADVFQRDELEPVVSGTDMPALRRLIAGRDRIWLVEAHDWYTDPDGLVRNEVQEEMDVLSHWWFQGVQVTLFRRQNPGMPSTWDRLAPDRPSRSGTSDSPALLAARLPLGV